MKVKLYTFLQLLVIAIILCSCEKEVSNLVPIDEKIVVNSFIAPSETLPANVNIQVSLTLSSPYYRLQNHTENTALKLKNATVLISDGSTQQQLIWDDLHSDFELSQNIFPIIAGKTYYLDIKAEDGRQVSAQTTIPNPVINPIFKFLGYKNNSTTGATILSVLYQLNDDGAISNSYRFYTEIEYNDPNFNYPLNEQGGNYLQADKDFNGSLFEKIIQFRAYSYDSYPNSSKKYTGYFIVCSNEYAQFYNSLAVVANYGANPFSEYANVYSNIKGGLGIFAGYNQTKVVSN